MTWLSDGLTKIEQEKVFVMKKTALMIMFLVACSAGSADDRYHDSQSQGITFGFPVNITAVPYMVSLRGARW